MSATDPVSRFWNAPDEALFSIPVIAEVLDCSAAKIERDRWKGRGLKLIKLDGMVRARKSDVLAWISECEAAQSRAIERAARAPATES